MTPADIDSLTLEDYEMAFTLFSNEFMGPWADFRYSRLIQYSGLVKVPTVSQERDMFPFIRLLKPNA